MTDPETRLLCAGCGTEVPLPRAIAWSCPAATPGDDIDHVLRRVLDPAVLEAEAKEEPSTNPFVRYRRRFHSYHVARNLGWSDGQYVDLVNGLDAAVASVDGRGFRVTPIVRSTSLDEELGFEPGAGVWVKDETGNVSGSHKARHLMGVMLALNVAEATGMLECDAPLAIASCGNAALAAAVVARAARRRLQVFVPPSADPAVIERLRELRAEIEVCERQPGQTGDPTVVRLTEAIAGGAVPFTVQGNLNGLTIEGGQTLGWELVDQLPDAASALDRVIIHVGGGAFATSMARALEEAVAQGQLERVPVIDTVQTQGGYPLKRAHELVLARLGVDAGAPMSPDAIDGVLEYAAHHRSEFMWAWESEPVSIAHGILDDETYDWLAVVVDEATLEAANALARPDLGIDADHTGTAGLAGLIQLTRDGNVRMDETVAVIFSGARRSSAAPSHQ